jgi:hypothetical protein
MVTLVSAEWVAERLTRGEFIIDTVKQKPSAGNISGQKEPDERRT